MIKLLKFGPHFGMPDMSPFVMKLETYMRLTDVVYEEVCGDVRKAPKGKFPCLIMEDKTIPDSQLAIDALKVKFGDKLNEGLSEKQRAEHHMVRLGLENHTYFMAVAYRWLRDENAPLMQKEIFSKMGFTGKLIFKLVQRDMRRTIYGQGILRHSWDEIDLMIKKDIEALEALIGDDDYFGGAQPREIDATTYGFISNMLVPEMDTPFRTIGRKSERLVAYHNRMSAKYFPECQAMII